MSRKTFSQILKNSGFNCEEEYCRLHYLFHNETDYDESLYKRCEYSFFNFPYRDTCISLTDFNNTFGFHFHSASDHEIDINYLISFCEYSYNLLNLIFGRTSFNGYYLEQVEKVIAKAKYMGNRKENGVVDFVPKNVESIIAAESVDDTKLSYDILEYNHHSMKGNIERKSKVLSSFANYFEPRRTELSNFNRSFEKNLFTMFNNFNIRHANSSDNNPLFEGITDEKLEEYYDITYELCLTAFSILGGLESNKKAKEIRTKLGK